MARYQHGCPCLACKECGRKAQVRARLKAIGRERGAIYDTDIVPSDEAIQRVREMIRRRKLSREEMARMTGVSSFTLGRLARPKIKSGGQYLRDPRTPPTITRRVDTAVAGLYAKVFADDETPRDMVPGSLVPVKKSKQIVYSLCAQGWSIEHLSEIIKNNTGESGQVLSSLRDKARKYVTKRTEDKVLWLARAIGDRTGPSKNNAAKFRKRGYFPLRHYNVYGDLMPTTLSREQRAILESVQS